MLLPPWPYVPRPALPLPACMCAQMDLDVQLQQAINYEAYERATLIRAKRKQVGHSGGPTCACHVPWPSSCRWAHVCLARAMAIIMQVGPRVPATCHGHHHVCWG